MPFLKFSRDKRGYEHFFLMQPSPRSDEGRPAAPRLLYWFRTPPNVRVGREPFDAAARRTLERQYPGVRFDWEALASTPIPPPPEAEPWRERRRAERAARRAAAADHAPEGPPPVEPAAGPEAAADLAPESHEEIGDEIIAPEQSGVGPAPESPAGGASHRRRRRRRRRGRGGGTPAPGGEPGGEL